MDLETFEKKLLKDPKFRKEYYKKDLAFEIGQMIAEARIIKGMTQEKLASLVRTKQSNIARAESGSHLPSLSFLKRVADAFSTYLNVNFAFMERSTKVFVITVSRNSKFSRDANFQFDSEPTVYSLAKTDSRTGSGHIQYND